MPTDVPLGMGYVGDALLEQRFPGQYREPAAAAAAAELQSPGTSFGYTPPTDPDMGRPLQMTEVPGIGLVAMSAEQIQQSMGAVTPVDHTMVGDWRGTSFSGMGSPLNLTESIASLLSGKDLDEFNRAMSRLMDSIVKAHGQLENLEEQESEIRGRMKSFPTLIPVPMGPPVPTKVGLANMHSMAAVREGYKALTGFTYMIHVFKNSFGAAAPAIRKVYSPIDGNLRQFGLWIDTWMKRVAPKKGMGPLFDKIQREHNRLYAHAAQGQPMDFNNEHYIGTANAAVEAVVGIKPESVGVSGMGIAISMIVLAIVAAVAIIGMLSSVLSLVKQYNVKANAIHAQRTSYENRMEEERKEYFERSKEAGAPIEQIQEEWDARKEVKDKEQDAKEQRIADQPGPPGIDLSALALPAALIGIPIVLSQVL